VLSAKCNAYSKRIFGSAIALPSKKLFATRHSLLAAVLARQEPRPPNSFRPRPASSFSKFSPQRHFFLLELASKWTEVKNDFCFQFLRRILWRSPHERASEPSAVMELRFCYYLPAQSCQPESWLWRQSVIDHQAT